MSRPRPQGRPRPMAGKALRGLLALLLCALLAACASHRASVTGGRTLRDDQARVPAEYHFADLNGEQLESARKYGLARPPKNRREAKRMARRLKRIEPCEAYLVDPLTHSVPYLTKGARSLLEDIAGGFQYVLRRQGIRPHRVIVTSLLRTEADVASLRRVNGAAARHSSHLYATTFDLSFTRYGLLPGTGRAATPAELARVLAIVIGEFRSRGDCVVIYEPGQHCFHVTARRR